MGLLVRERYTGSEELAEASEGGYSVPPFEVEGEQLYVCPLQISLGSAPLTIVAQRMGHFRSSRLLRSND